MNKRFIFNLFFFLPIFLFADESLDERIERWIDAADSFGIPPKQVKWSGDGKVCAFLWNEEGSRRFEIYLFYPSRNKIEKLTEIKDITNPFPHTSANTEKQEEKPFERYSGISEYVWHPRKSVIYFVFNGDIYKTDIKEKKAEIVIRTKEKESLLKISPDGTWLSFIRSNNIWLLGLENNTEIQLTFTGSPNVINGYCWYPRLGDDYSAYGWNPISNAIAYITTDLTPCLNYVNSKSPENEIKHLDIPNAESPLPKYSVNVAFIRSGKTVQIDTGPPGKYYILQLLWRPSSLDLLTMREERNLRKISFYLANSQTGKADIILQEEDPKCLDTRNRFVDFSPNGILLYYTSEIDGWNHLYSLGIKSNEKKQLTGGNWEITGLNGIDQAGNIYFTSTRIRPTQRHLERILQETGMIEQMTYVEGYHTSFISPDFSGAVELFRGNFIAGDLFSWYFDKPYQRYRITRQPAGYLSIELHEPKYITFRNLSDGKLVFGRIWRIENKDSEQKQPAIILLQDSVGGASVTRTLKKRDILPQILAEEGYAVLEFDYRGTPGYGRDWRTDIYKKAGEIELEDIASAAEYLKSEPFIDTERIGIIGTGYGGYLAILAISKNIQPIKSAIALWPFFDWKNTESRFTESRLGNILENDELYKKAELKNYIPFVNNSLLIVSCEEKTDPCSCDSGEYFKKIKGENTKIENEILPLSSIEEGDRTIRLKLLEKIINYLKENL